jgi:hypothetical protein
VLLHAIEYQDAHNLLAVCIHRWIGLDRQLLVVNLEPRMTAWRGYARALEIALFIAGRTRATEPG